MQHPVTHGNFSRIDHMLGHKTSLSKFKKIEIISGIFTNNNNMKLEINYRKKTGKNRHVETKHMLLNNQWVNEEIKEEI